MRVPRTLPGIMLAIGVSVAALPASAAGLFGVHGNGSGFRAPFVVGVGHYAKGHRHHHGRHQGRRGRGIGRGHLSRHAIEHRHGGLGWHVHREWRRQAHPRPHRHRPHHRSHRDDGWEEGAGIALGVLAGILLLNQFADSGSVTGSPGLGSAHSLSLDVHSRHRQKRAIRSALEAGGNRIVAWNNPANWGGFAEGEVRILRNGRDDFGNPCREYHQTLRVGHRIVRGSRVACRDRNGNWHLQ